ncbi:hypothetical protein LTS17_002502 [Exophiala oligosperma]
MYPDWPESDADLVPLPQVDGPKLKPFKFSGARKIEFLEYAGAGTHAQVFKVKMEGEIFALKVFRWTHGYEWPGQDTDPDAYSREAFTAFGNHAEPFNCECRAFARLQESGHEDLAIRCFGYVLINEEEEKEMVDRFEVSFDSEEVCGFPAHMGKQRARYPGKRSGRGPPLRAIVKAFGKVDAPFNASVAKKMFRDIVQLHQLGIASLDVANRQLVDGKPSDLSQALTTPNFIMTPELNPLLSSEQVARLENETFRCCRTDFSRLEDLVYVWNNEHEKARDKIWIDPFPSQSQRNLRKVPSRRNNLPYTFADPRLYDWRKSSLASDESEGSITATAKGGKRQRPGGAVDSVGGSRGSGAKKKQRRMDLFPARWYYECDDKEAADLDRFQDSYPRLTNYEYRDGLIFPPAPKKPPPPRAPLSELAPEHRRTLEAFGTIPRQT